MKQFTIIFLVIFSLLINSLTAYVDDQFKHGRKLMGENALPTYGATLAITDFEKDGDSGEPAECDNLYHSNDKFLVALSTKWYDDGKKCYKGITINYNGKNTIAMVVDECDTNDGCSDDMVAASKAVWRALQVPESEWGDEIQVTWSFLWN